MTDETDREALFVPSEERVRLAYRKWAFLSTPEAADRDFDAWLASVRGSARVQSTRDEIADVLWNSTDAKALEVLHYTKDRSESLIEPILALFSSTPTVAQVQAEALREIAPEVSNRYGDRERLIARADALDPKEEN